jgi:pimeloyl-ACP methyl ester carboxylesterase
MAWRQVVIDGRVASYGVAGAGPAVVFLHGWGLSHRTYRNALERLVRGGVRVWAPALPGFGGTAALRVDRSLAGYADWLVEFLDAVGVDGAVTLVGHSFGGGVAIVAADRYPDRVARLVLVNSIGGSVWRSRGERSSPMAERPAWDWGLHIAAHALSVRSLIRVLPVIASDVVPNAVLHPDVMWHVGSLARDADLTRELNRLKRRRLPVVILWGRQDRVVPWACAESLRIALGADEVVTVPGNHGWLLDDPGRFAEILTNILSPVAPVTPDEDGTSAAS